VSARLESLSSPPPPHTNSRVHVLAHARAASGAQDKTSAPRSSASYHCSFLVSQFSSMWTMRLKPLPDLHSLSTLHNLRYLQVDDLKAVDALEEYIDCSQVIQIFVSKGYFVSKNCLREARTAVEKSKPLVLLHDPDGSTIDSIRENECPATLQSIFKDREVIEWHRIKVSNARAPTTREDCPELLSPLVP